MNYSTSLSQDLIDVMQTLKDLRLSYQVVYYSEEDCVEIETFDNPQKALDFYISIADELNPSIKCLITASMGNFFCSSIAPITLRSLTDIVDADNKLPRRVEETARKAIGRRILKGLPFNSEAHCCII